MSLQNASQENIKKWLQAFHKASDSLTTDDLGKFYTKDASMNYANNPLLVGFDAIIATFASVFPVLSSMKHELVNVDVISNKIYQTCTITYIVKDDPQNRTITVPAMGVFHLVPGADFKSGEPLIKHFDGFMDVSEVFGIIGEVQKLKSEGMI